MTRWLNPLFSAGGLVGCCAAAVQVTQLADGRAAPELMNYVLTALTAATGLGLSGLAWRGRGPSAADPNDEQAIVAALDLLFAHFPDDPAAQEAIRTVARAVMDRRYPKVGPAASLHNQQPG
jgi:hypothetical protein